MFKSATETHQVKWCGWLKTDKREALNKKKWNTKNVVEQRVGNLVFPGTKETILRMTRNDLKTKLMLKSKPRVD